MKKKNKDEKVSESFHAWWGMLEARAKPHPMSAHEGLSLWDAPGSSLHSLSLSLSLSLTRSLTLSVLQWKRSPWLVGGLEGYLDGNVSCVDKAYLQHKRSGFFLPLSSSPRPLG